MTLDEAILKLTLERDITGQTAFLALLKRAGFEVTQPTLSRHMRKLGILKVAGHYRRADTAPAEMPSFMLIPVPPNLLTLRTRPGYAQPLAVRIDQEKIAGIAGTVAGDDTVFIAMTAPSFLKDVAAAVDALFSGKAPP